MVLVLQWLQSCFQLSWCLLPSTPFSLWRQKSLSEPFCLRSCFTFNVFSYIFEYTSVYTIRSETLIIFFLIICICNTIYLLCFKFWKNSPSFSSTTLILLFSITYLLFIISSAKFKSSIALLHVFQ